MIMYNKFGKAKAGDIDRRAFLQASVAVATIAAIGGSLGSLAHAAALTRAQRDQMTAEQIIATMKRGNERFRTGKEKPHNYLAQQKASAKGQYPVAVILSCIDSRAPAETIMDLGIGDVFNARVAGNQATIGSWSSG
jgi:carbonic anhydrase